MPRMLCISNGFLIGVSIHFFQISSGLCVFKSLGSTLFAAKNNVKMMKQQSVKMKIMAHSESSNGDK